MLEALAARELAMMSGLRVSMTVRLAGVSPGALLASPAYLAMDGPDTIWLQVLSPFGVTVLDLTIDGERYELRMPLKAEVRRGRIEPAAIAAPGTPPAERMAIALALLFRPKISAATCRGDTGAAITCAVGAGMVATVTVDGALRPIRERYAREDGTVVLLAEYGDYESAGPSALPGRIAIRDVASDTTMIARVLRSRSGPALDAP